MLTLPVPCVSVPDRISSMVMTPSCNPLSFTWTMQEKTTIIKHEYSSLFATHVFLLYSQSLKYNQPTPGVLTKASDISYDLYPSIRHDLGGTGLSKRIVLYMEVVCCMICLILFTLLNKVNEKYLETNLHLSEQKEIPPLPHGLKILKAHRKVFR